VPIRHGEQYKNVDILFPEAPPLVGGVAFLYSPQSCAVGMKNPFFSLIYMQLLPKKYCKDYGNHYNDNPGTSGSNNYELITKKLNPQSGLNINIYCPKNGYRLRRNIIILWEFRYW